MRMVTLPMAAFRLELSYMQVYRMVLAGKLRGERRGSRWYVRSDDVERLKRCERDPNRETSGRRNQASPAGSIPAPSPGNN